MSTFLKTVQAWEAREAAAHHLLQQSKKLLFNGQGQKNFVRQQRFCFAHNSETKAAKEKVNAPFYSTN
jgi:hypothetical protein